MAIERLNVPLPSGFDASKHGGALVALVSRKHGEGWELESIDPGDGTATMTRQVTLTEVRASQPTSPTKAVNLPRGTKPADGDKMAARFEDQHPGFYLTSFEPYLGKATLTKLTPDEARCRGAVALALGVKPWQVSVTGRRDGGFDLDLPTYSPSKHGAKLEEVATEIVGKPGWYVQVDAATNTASLIPADLPTFPAMYPYPFDDDASAQFRIPVGVGLGGQGRPNAPAVVDLDGTAGVLATGLAGSGKATELAGLIPVPVSDRFPTGWARNGDLIEGDQVYAVDGSVTTVVGFSDVVSAPGYRVTFSDGQTVTADAGHLWKASSAASRTTATPLQVRKAQARALAEPRQRSMSASAVAHKAAELRSLATQIGAGTMGTLSDIARLIGYNPVTLYRYAADFEHLATPVRAYDTRRPGYAFDMTALASYWDTAPCDAPRFARYALTPQDIESVRGTWMTGIEFVEHLVARGADRSAMSADATEKLGTIARRVGAERKHVGVPRTVTTYPVDEVLVLLAEHFEANVKHAAPVEKVVTTREMYESLRYGQAQRANWAVRVTEAVDGPEVDLPVDPYVLGAWLGDGSVGGGQVASHPDDQPDLIAHLTAAGYEATPTPSNVFLVGVRGGLSRDLRTAGVLGDKHIPAAYLRASKAQRLALLQGLMDTDGHVGADGTCEFVQGGVHKDLVMSVLELVRSLGIKATAPVWAPSHYTSADGERVECSGKYRLAFTTDLPVFRLPRKAERLPVPGSLRQTQQWNYITSIEVVEPVQMRCLKVAHPEHLFLVEGFIPTHNSVWSQSFLFGLFRRGWQVAIINAPQKKTDFEWAKPYVREHGWGCESKREAVAVARLVHEEGVRRGRLLAEHSASKWQDLPADVRRENPPLMLVGDELAAQLMKEAEPKGLPREHPQRLEVQQENLESDLLAVTLAKIPAEMRAAGIRVLYLTQQAQANFGIGPKIKVNLPHRVLLGSKPSKQQLGHAFQVPEKLPTIPQYIVADDDAARGVGIAEFEGQTPQVFKGFFATTETYLERMTAIELPRASRPEPSATQVGRLVPQIAEELADDGPPRSGLDAGGFGAPDGRDAPEPRLKGAAAAARQLAVDAAQHARSGVGS
ncbi:hypothetical protein [Isoptericola croceus]|uniref:hypothetical protein n=1 Tax=Isoptericola croceus TaxID=3031406 RepID=UPI0023F6F640|nr:hypothetical protein [Isoptericola croceus]